MPSHYFTMLAHYNIWANRRLFEACEALSASEYMRERASFFGSFHGTLNHILVADRIWIARIEGQTPPNLRLDQILYGDLTGLKVARLAEDDHIRIMIENIPEGRLEQPFGYRDSRGNRFKAPLHFVLGHFFNHQTHHRGQVHDLLCRTEVPPPPLDLIEFLRQGTAGQTAVPSN